MPSGGHAKPDIASAPVNATPQPAAQATAVPLVQQTSQTRNQNRGAGLADLAGSRNLPGGLRLDEIVTVSTATGAVAVEIFSGYPLPPGVDATVAADLLAFNATTMPLSLAGSSVGVVPLFVTYTGPAASMPTSPVTVVAVSPTTGQFMTFAVTFVPADPATGMPAVPAL